VNLQRIYILFDLEFLKDVGFHFDTNLAANITQIFNLQSTFQTSTIIENNDYMRVMLDIDLSGNSYPKVADVITTNTYNLNLRMGILEYNNSGGSTAGRTTSSTGVGGDMGDYTLITTTDALETNVIAKIDDHESRIINKSETNDPVFNIAGFGNGKTMNDIVAYYAPTTDLSSYVTTSHFESIYDGIDSRFDIVDATIQKNKNDLQNRITSVDNRFNLVDARIQGNKIDLQNRIKSVDNRFNLVDTSIQGTTIYLEAFEKLAQGHTQQNTTQNIRLQQIDGEIKSLDGKIGTNTNTIRGMGNAITQIMRRLYSDDRLKNMKSSSKMLLQHCLN